MVANYKKRKGIYFGLLQRIKQDYHQRQCIVQRYSIFILAFVHYIYIFFFNIFSKIKDEGYYTRFIPGNKRLLKCEKVNPREFAAFKFVYICDRVYAWIQCMVDCYLTARICSVFIYTPRRVYGEREEKGYTGTVISLYIINFSSFSTYPRNRGGKLVA